MIRTAPKAPPKKRGRPVKPLLATEAEHIAAGRLVFDHNEPNGNIVYRATEHIRIGSPKRRGRPPSDKVKVMVNLRLDPEVVAKFKADGPGWQTRINEALRDVKKPLASTED